MTQPRKEEEIPAAAQRAILQRQITVWQNTRYEAQVQARVAKVIGNDDLATIAARQAEEAIRALDELALILQETYPDKKVGHKG